jgi:hypothetical protein
MTEQIVEGVVSAEVDAESRRIVHKGTLGAETSAVPMERLNVTWQIYGQGHLVGQHSKTLTERFNEAYREEARQEDEEFFRTTKAYYRRRFNAED